MDDLYGKKAQKYKLKYLKLKKEYIAKGGMYGSQLYTPQQFANQQEQLRLQTFETVHDQGGKLPFAN
jgi:hypothetical protein